MDPWPQVTPTKERFWNSFPHVPCEFKLTSHITGVQHLGPGWCQNHQMEAVLFFQGILKYSLGHKNKRKSSYILKA